MSRWPGAIYKSFTSLAEAEQWVSTPNPMQRECSVTSCYCLRFCVLTDVFPTVGILPDAEYPWQTSATAPQAESSISRGKMKAPEPMPQHDTSDSESIPIDVKEVPPDIILSEEQRRVIAMVERGENIFFTGSAGNHGFTPFISRKGCSVYPGTGKSVLLREIIRVRGGRGHPDLAITASTGIASVNIGGTTVHSWAGIGLGTEDPKRLAGKFLGQPKFLNVRDRWRKVRTLVLDESVWFSVAIQKLSLLIYFQSL